MENLIQLHEQVKNHPFRLGDKKQWKEYHTALRLLDKAFTAELEKKFTGYSSGWGFFIHELRSAIWHFEFEYSEELGGRKSCKGTHSKDASEYGRIIPEYQSKIIIILEQYISQIHHFITTGEFIDYITYYMGGEKCMDEIQSNGKSRWNKYKYNKDEDKFEWVGKVE